MADVTVVDNGARSRYEAHVDGRLAGHIQYHRTSRYLDFLHTQVEPEFEGRGVGSRLAAGALDDVRAHRGRVLATCPFIRAYLQRHPEYADLVVTRA